MTEHASPHVDWPQGAIFTVGHSTLPIERFARLLQTYGIERLVDIRTIPRSQHNPQFNDTALAGRVAAAHLEYVHCPALGGLRHPGRTRSTRAGGTRAFAGTRTTCKRRSLQLHSKPSFK